MAKGRTEPQLHLFLLQGLRARLWTHLKRLLSGAGVSENVDLCKMQEINSSISSERQPPTLALTARRFLRAVIAQRERTWLSHSRLRLEVGRCEAARLA